MKIRVLGSSSDGNCTLLQFTNDDKWYMFDAGISYIKTKLEDIKPEYCFITHRHYDHISRVNAIQDITTVCGMQEEFDNPKCARYIRDFTKLKFLKEYEYNKLGDITVLPLPADHDTDQPVHYWVTNGYEAFFYGCDCGYIPHEYDWYLDMCTAIMVECDYDDRAMRTDVIDHEQVKYKYDKDLKKRVRETHCSTHYISERFKGKKNVIVGHISNNYNSKKNVEKMGFMSVDRTECPKEFIV